MYLNYSHRSMQKSAVSHRKPKPDFSRSKTNSKTIRSLKKTLGPMFATPNYEGRESVAVIDSADRLHRDVAEVNHQYADHELPMTDLKAGSGQVDVRASRPSVSYEIKHALTTPERQSSVLEKVDRHAHAVAGDSLDESQVVAPAFQSTPARTSSMSDHIATSTTQQRFNSPSPNKSTVTETTLIFTPPSTQRSHGHSTSHSTLISPRHFSPGQHYRSITFASTPGRKVTDV
jgi:hypothetical protein